MGEIRILLVVADLGGTGLFWWCLVRLGWSGMLDVLVIVGWLDPCFLEEGLCRRVWVGGVVASSLWLWLWRCG